MTHNVDGNEVSMWLERLVATNAWKDIHDTMMTPRSQTKIDLKTLYFGAEWVSMMRQQSWEDLYD